MRISVTTLEAFRLYVQPEQTWMSEDALKATIYRTDKPTRPMRIGTAFGRVIEAPERYRVDGGYACDGYTFDDRSLWYALDGLDRRGVFEAKAVGVYAGHDVVAKADYLLGTELHEFKTRIGSVDVERYLASYQWRFMVDLFGASKVTYHVFSLKDHDNTVVECTGATVFSQYPYRGLHQDCCDLVESFAAFVTAKGWTDALEPSHV